MQASGGALGDAAGAAGRRSLAPRSFRRESCWLRPPCLRPEPIVSPCSFQGRDFCCAAGGTGDPLRRGVAWRGLNRQDLKKVIYAHAIPYRHGLNFFERSGPSRGGGASLDSPSRPCGGKDTQLASELPQATFLILGPGLSPEERSIGVDGLGKRSGAS